jgi:hypothetical protein
MAADQTSAPTRRDYPRCLGKVVRVTALAESIDAVIGVDTHRDTLAAAAVSALGGVLARLRFAPTLPAIGS